MTKPVTFQSIHKKSVTVTFSDPWDIRSMRAHPEYVEVFEDGTTANVKPETREDWEMPVQLNSTIPTAKKRKAK